MELGTPAWLTAVVQAVNASDDYRERGAGWRWPLGLGFLDPADEGRDRFGVLDLHDGRCRGAVATDRQGFGQAQFRLSASYPRWDRVLHGRIDAMRCILLGTVRLEGDRLTALRYLPAAKALMDAMATVEADTPVA